MDVLSDVLTSLQLESAIHFCPELSAPWGVDVPAQSGRAIFYVLSRGSCYLQVHGVKVPTTLAGGDLVLLPHGAAHTLRDRLETPAISLARLLENGCRTGRPQATRGASGGGASAFVSGYFLFESRAASQFLAPLPPLIHIRPDTGQIVPWLDATLKFLSCEATADRPGARIIMARLTDVLLIQILRAHIAQTAGDVPSCKNNGMLRALADPQIGKALQLMHERPKCPWRVAELAEHVSMSRTGFAVRFKAPAGVAPLDYLTKWRMQKAGDYLQLEDQSIDQIAERVGYESGVAFSKAFKREMGVAPGQFRKKQGSAGA